MKNRAAHILLRLLLAFAVCSPFLRAQNTATAKASEPVKPHLRTITAFIVLNRSQYQLQLADTTKFLHYAQTVFESRGYTVETLRIVTQPFPEYTKGMSTDEAVRFFKNLDGIAEQNKIRLNVGSAYL